MRGSCRPGPLPGLPPNQRADLGEGEFNIFMETKFTAQLTIAPPLIEIANWGGQGGGQMHKRTTPRVFGYAPRPGVRCQGKSYIAI
jgi:hypothetical protein